MEKVKLNEHEIEAIDKAKKALKEVMEKEVTPRKYLPEDEFQELLKSGEINKSQELCPHCGDQVKGFCTCDSSLYDYYKEVEKVTGNKLIPDKKEYVPTGNEIRRTDLPEVKRNPFSKKAEPIKPIVVEELEEEMVQKPIKVPEAPELPKEGFKERLARRQTPKVSYVFNAKEDEKIEPLEEPNVEYKEPERTRLQDNKESQGERQDEDILDVYVRSKIGEEGFPSKDQLKEWELKYKDVYYLALDQRDVYFFKKLLTYEDEAIRDNIKTNDEYKYNIEYNKGVCKICTLYPGLDSPIGFANLPAGVINSLANSILAFSHVVPFDKLVSLIRKI